MKKSKILVPALAVLALGMAGTATATVAWFQVQTTAKITANSITDTAITCNAPTDTTEYGYTISAAVSRTVGDGKNLLLTEKGQSGLASKVWDSGGQLIDYNPKDTEALYYEYTVTLTGNWDSNASSLTPEAKHAMLNGAKVYSITWSISGTNADRARISAASSFATEYASSAAAANRKLNSVNVKDFLVLTELPETPSETQIKQFTGEAQQQEVKFYVRADGDQATDDAAHADSTALSFTISGVGSIA